MLELVQLRQDERDPNPSKLIRLNTAQCRFIVDATENYDRFIFFQAMDDLGLIHAVRAGYTRSKNSQVSEEVVVRHARAAMEDIIYRQPKPNTVLQIGEDTDEQPYTAEGGFSRLYRAKNMGEATVGSLAEVYFQPEVFEPVET